MKMIKSLSIIVLLLSVFILGCASVQDPQKGSLVKAHKRIGEVIQKYYEPGHTVYFLSEQDYHTKYGISHVTDNEFLVKVRLRDGSYFVINNVKLYAIVSEGDSVSLILNCFVRDPKMCWLSNFKVF